MEEDVFGDGAGAVEGVVLGDDADAAAGEGRVGDDVDAGDGDLACGGDGAGGADGDGGGFAGAVGAEQAVDGAGFDVEVDTVDGGDAGLAAVDFTQRADFDDHVNTPAILIIGIFLSMLLSRFQSVSIPLSVSLLLGTWGFAQSQTPLAPGFEVASVKRVASLHCCTEVSAPGSARFTAKVASLAYLVAIAYGVSTNQISGKLDWEDTEYYDVAAEADHSLSPEELRLALQRLLIERFHLQVHREMREVPGYALVVAKGGARLKPTDKPPTGGYIMADGLRNPSLSVKGLAGMLVVPLGRQVEDQTGLAGNFDVDLHFAPQGSTDSTLPSIFTAIGELGLKLESRKIKIEYLVIDGADRVPIEN